MIHYHGTPIPISDDQVSRVLKGKFAFISFAHPEDLSIAMEVSAGFALDNGAFSIWKQGNVDINLDQYYEWVDSIRHHPAYQWFIIPDKIEGSEKENDELLKTSPFQEGVPVWHTSESIQRLEHLVNQYPYVCIGSSQGHTPNTGAFWNKMYQAMEVCCDKEGKPKTKLHGLRQLQGDIISKIPYASADSINMGRNLTNHARWSKAMYEPISFYVRAQVLIDRIEAVQSPSVWEFKPIQQEFLW